MSKPKENREQEATPKHTITEVSRTVKIVAGGVEIHVIKLWRKNGETGI